MRPQNSRSCRKLKRCRMRLPVRDAFIMPASGSISLDFRITFLTFWRLVSITWKKWQRLIGILPGSWSVSNIGVKTEKCAYRKLESHALVTSLGYCSPFVKLKTRNAASIPTEFSWNLLCHHHHCLLESRSMFLKSTISFKNLIYRINSCAECPQGDLDKIKSKLLQGNVVYRAHHLGVVEVNETDGSEEAHLAMTNIKGSITDWESIPRVTLDLTCNGITIFDESFKTLLDGYGVYTIRVVCQDRKDLNFFCFVARDPENRFYCHTFCVLTSVGIGNWKTRTILLVPGNRHWYHHDYWNDVWVA